MTTTTLQPTAPESPPTRTHARVSHGVTRNGNSHIRARVCDPLHAPSRIRARTRDVTSGGVTVDDLPEILRVPSLYDHQHRAVSAAIAGRDVLTIAPTGGGKFESFVGAGLVRGGLTVIVAPLRSLIADQSRRLEALNLPYRVWNSDVKDAAKAETLSLLRGDWCGFVLTTPESLKGRELSSHLVGRIELAVVDEAHCCLRDRGFRVSYAWLGSTLSRLRPVFATRAPPQCPR